MKIEKYKNEAIIAIIGMAAYAVSVVNDFHTDDWLVLNSLRDGLSLKEFLSMETLDRFRPLTNFLLYLRYLILGDVAGGYYVLNIMSHAAFSIFLYRFLLKIGLDRTASFTAAVLFSVYFPHYEAVLWLYGSIRILGAFFWIASLWTLHDLLEECSGHALVVFTVVCTLGYFVVEDMVVAPIGYATFILLMGNRRFLRMDLARVLGISLGSLAMYFILRSVLIAEPGVIEGYYYPGFHMFSRLGEYLTWMMIPGPDHSYFTGLAGRLGPVGRTSWRVASSLSMASLIVACIYAILRASRPVKFFSAFMVIALLPAIPLSFKVASRNIYIPSIGLAVVGGYYFDRLLTRWRYKRIRRLIAIGFFSLYAMVSVMSIGVASIEYRKTQVLVAGMIADLKIVGKDLNEYDNILIDHMPGRAIVGPAIAYRFGFSHNVIASNDPTFGPINILAATRKAHDTGRTYVVFDYRGGHLVEVTDEYISLIVGTGRE